ncbi:hypothetical protein HG263_06890 [Pseudoalteromonas sp. JBTF-M23]|uniref:Uncharacterized protein n=2 Tax=Pseudoalteromonas caenipelagi TaxID=2726988 RepID=A0A849VEV8_9GAMM|nr:hypothetical protein [Pseudoalteromonas caenipelagi]
MQFQAVNMMNTKTGEIEFYTVLVTFPKLSPTYCFDSNGILRFETMEQAQEEASRLANAYEQH